MDNIWLTNINFSAFLERMVAQPYGTGLAMCYSLQVQSLAILLNCRDPDKLFMCMSLCSPNGTNWYWPLAVTTWNWHGSSWLEESIVVWPTTSCFADWSKHCHVTLRIIDCKEVVLTWYRIFTTCHLRPRDMSTHVTWSRVTCCKYSTKMKSRVRFPADH